MIFHKNISKNTKNFSASGITFINKILAKLVRSPINFLSFFGSDKTIYHEKTVVIEYFGFFFIFDPLVQN